MKYALTVLAAFAFSASAAKKQDITYFACTVKEGSKNVSVKFAINNFKPNSRKGTLVTYPGADEDQGMILVEPVMVKKDEFSKSSNLNGQGGDLSFDPGGDIRLFGDGDGYQFTDLVLFNEGDDDRNFRDGYMRDYGSAYQENQETFKVFVKCKHAKNVL